MDTTEILARFDEQVRRPSDPDGLYVGRETGAKLTWRIVDRQGGLEPPEVVTPTTNGINVTVKFSGSPAPAYGKSFYVGWSKKTLLRIISSRGGRLRS